MKNTPPGTLLALIFGRCAAVGGVVVALEPNIHI